MAWYVFLLAAAGGIAFATWNYHRRTVARRAASEARFEKIFKGQGPAPASAQPPSAAPVEPPVAANTLPATPAAPSLATRRFLGQAESLLYYLLKAGLPDFEVFAGVSLARVVGAAGSGRDREQQLRRLSQYQLDFVICDKSLKVVSVIEVESAAEAAGDQRFKSDLLTQAGIRLVRVNPAALPRREQVRALIDGEPLQSNG